LFAIPNKIQRLANPAIIKSDHPRRVLDCNAISIATEITDATIVKNKENLMMRLSGLKTSGIIGKTSSFTSAVPLNSPWQSGQRLKTPFRVILH
jgi:hypothetical protein